jgi:hypothetical protein
VRVADIQGVLARVFVDDLPFYERLTVQRFGFGESGA